MPLHGAARLLQYVQLQYAEVMAETGMRAGITVYIVASDTRKD